MTAHRFQGLKPFQHTASGSALRLSVQFRPFRGVTPSVISSLDRAALDRAATCEGEAVVFLPCRTCLDLRGAHYGPGIVSPLTRRTCWTRRSSLPVSITAP